MGVSFNPNSATIPKGAVVLWSGTIANIPLGYALCDGSNGTHDLRNRFVICADADSAGVAKTTIEGFPQISGGNVQAHVLDGNLALGSGLQSGIASYSAAINDPAVIGDDDASTILPRYYALAYIQKL